MTKTSRRLKGFQKAGNKRGAQAATVVFVPSTKGGLLVKKLKEKEESLAEMTGFKIMYQEAG